MTAHSAQTGTLGTVTLNDETNSVEIILTKKTSGELRGKLLASGFILKQRPPWKWYQRASDAAWVRACQLAGVHNNFPLNGSDGERRAEAGESQSGPPNSIYERTIH